MRLWSEDFDGLRAEARQAVADGIGALQEVLGEPAVRPTEPLERVRRQRERFAVTFTPVPEARECVIAGVPCRVFRPDRAVAAVYLHFHGGGMVLGAPEMNDLGNRELCRRFDLAVISVDYRLAPEHPFPAGPDDGVAVADWLLEHSQSEFGTDRLLIGGESAGGYMAAAVLIRLRDERNAARRFSGANLVFGVYDWGRSPSQRGIRAASGPDILEPEGIAFFTECYLPGRNDDERRHPTVSPAFADLRDMPRAFMSVGGADHLLDDTLMLASRWVSFGNEVELFVAPDMPHGFMAFPCALVTAWLVRTQEWFERVLAIPR